MTIFLLVPSLLIALAVAGIVWIRATVAEYRHHWSVPQGGSRGMYRER
jgi:hypothetical protein